MSNEPIQFKPNDRGVLCLEDYGVNPASMYDQMDTRMAYAMRSTTDDDLRAMRKQLVSARQSLQKKLRDLGDDKYSTHAGTQLFADVAYYDGVIRKIEMEMGCRLLLL